MVTCQGADSPWLLATRGHCTGTRSPLPEHGQSGGPRTQVDITGVQRSRARVARKGLRGALCACYQHCPIETAGQAPSPERLAGQDGRCAWTCECPVGTAVHTLSVANGRDAQRMGFPRAHGAASVRSVCKPGAGQSPQAGPRLRESPGRRPRSQRAGAALPTSLSDGQRGRWNWPRNREQTKQNPSEKLQTRTLGMCKESTTSPLTQDAWKSS